MNGTAKGAFLVQEKVGDCKACLRPVYCNDGFLTGAVMEDQSLLCLECIDREQADERERDT